MTERRNHKVKRKLEFLFEQKQLSHWNMLAYYWEWNWFSYKSLDKMCSKGFFLLRGKTLKLLCFFSICKSNLIIESAIFFTNNCWIRSIFFFFSFSPNRNQYLKNWIKTHTYINTQKNCFSLSPSKYRRIRNYSIFLFKEKQTTKKQIISKPKTKKKNHKTAKNTSKKFKNKMNTKKCVNDLKISNKKRKLKSREKNYEKTDWALFNLTTIQYEFIFRNPWNFRTNSDRFHFHLIGFAFDWNCHYLSLVMQ